MAAIKAIVSGVHSQLASKVGAMNKDHGNDIVMDKGGKPRNAAQIVSPAGGGKGLKIDIKV
ncbi:hypothetical protein [Gimibacter soli]|uniref:Uncharacterized protein n=1 Tax=Gimibacter soli TaxID=3024400 RepID=A0AAE9XV90_9PROT|nr:hypothetical protein [Gimibacter soli]WCL55430.1 hypothetical protein PH603_06615 [Gimibacter soli]